MLLLGVPWALAVPPVLGWAALPGSEFVGVCWSTEHLGTCSPAALGAAGLPGRRKGQENPSPGRKEALGKTCLTILGKWPAMLVFCLCFREAMHADGTGQSNWKLVNNTVPY